MSLKERIGQVRESAEFQSGTVRLGVWVFAVTYVGLSSMVDFYQVDVERYITLFSIYLGLFLGIFTSVLYRPEWVARQFFSLVVDITATSFAIFLTGHATSPFFILYFWLFLSYGTRFGKRHLLAASSISTIAYMATVQAMDGWQEYGFEVSFILLSLILLPLYQLSLLHQLRKAKEMAELSRHEAEASSQAKSSFLANMSHEIRTPLNGLMGMGQLLLSTRLDTQQHEYTDNLLSTGRALTTLLNEVLDFSKIEAGVVEVKPFDFSLRPLLDEVMQLMRFSAEAKSLRLEYHCSPEIPDQLHGDASRLRQVLINIIGNALRFTEEGEVAVCVDSVESGTETIRLRFSIIDTGIGIQPEQRDRLFERFTQLDDTPARCYGGTGLGLAISKHLVEAMGGCIDVKSEYGHGSTFWFELPLLRAYGEDVFKGEEPKLASVQGLHIMLVDDDAINRLAGQRMLEQEGCRVTLACDGKEALNLLQKLQVDLVLMDIHMPNLDGIEATRRIRQSRTDAEPHLPIVGLTASVMKDEQQRYREAGMDDVVTKPVDIDTLLRTIRRVSGHTGAYPLRDAQG